MYTFVTLLFLLPTIYAIITFESLFPFASILCMVAPLLQSQFSLPSGLTLYSAVIIVISTSLSSCVVQVPVVLYIVFHDNLLP